jgi:alanine dehydrogenase
VIDESHIAGELGELVAGRIPGRTDADGVTIFKSLGMAVEDVVAAELVLTRARAAGVGQSLGT